YSGDKLGAMEHEITFFVKNQNENYKKIIENHFQQVFTKDIYLESLEKAGIKDIKIRDNIDLKTDKITKKNNRFIIIKKKKHKKTKKKIIKNKSQQRFTKDLYRKSLEKAGFKDIKIISKFDLKTDKLTKEVDRFFIIAKK